MENKHMFTRQVVLHQEEDGGYWVEVPSLPGCVSQGDSKDEALANIKEAIELYIESLQANGDPIPEENVVMVKV